MARQANVGCGCLLTGLVGLIILGAVANLSSERTTETGSSWAVIGVAVLVVVIVGVVKVSRRSKAQVIPDTCMLCHGPIGRKVYTVVVNGNRMTTCATCGRQLARKASKQAVERLTSQE